MVLCTQFPRIVISFYILVLQAQLKSSQIDVDIKLLNVLKTLEVHKI